MQREGRERWTLACAWQESKPTRGVCASICVLIDEMNSGSGKLILAEADLPLFPSWLACRSAFCVHSALVFPSLLLTPPLHQLVPLACFLSLTLKADLKMGGGGDNTNKVGYLVLSVLFDLTGCLLAQVKLLHHFCISFTVFHFTCKPNHLSSLRISATFLFNIS